MLRMMKEVHELILTNRWDNFDRYRSIFVLFIGVSRNVILFTDIKRLTFLIHLEPDKSNAGESVERYE